MGLLKEKTSYRPSRPEVVLAWVFTGAAGLAVAWFLAEALFGGPR